MRIKNVMLALLATLTFNIYSIAPLSAMSSGGNTRQKVLISFHDMPGQSGRRLVQTHGGQISQTYDNFPVIAAELPERAAANLAANPRVKIVEPDFEAQAVAYAASDEISNPWGIKHIGADKSIAGGNTGSKVKVAVIDSGVDYTHPDLKDNFDLNNLGRDSVQNDNNPMDVYGHGTHVAGSLAAAKDSFGVVGVAPEVQLFALRVLDDNGYGSHSTIIGALDWLATYNNANADNPIRITNNSYTSGGSSTALKNGFDTTASQGVLHIAAAGNSGTRGGNNDSVIYPAKYSTVVAVAAINKDNQRATWSSTGPDVELTAPGVSVLSTWNGPKSYANPQPFSWTDSNGQIRYYKEGSGTSMASPHVAGVAAAVWGVNDKLTNQQIRNIMNDTAQDIGLKATHQGHGLVRADAAVSSVLPDEPIDKGSIEGVVSNEDGFVTNATVETSTKSVSTNNEGYYLLQDLPVGSHEVTVKVIGHKSQTAVVTVERDQIVTQNFILEKQETAQATVKVAGVNYESSGGRTQDKHLNVILNIQDDQEQKVQGASVSFSVKNKSTDATWLATGTTDSSGNISLSINSVPTGCYETSVQSVSSNGLTWDEKTPANEWCKN